MLAALCKEEIPLLLAMMGAVLRAAQTAWWPLIVTRRGGRPGSSSPWGGDPPLLAYTAVAPFLERYSAYGLERERSRRTSSSNPVRPPAICSALPTSRTGSSSCGRSRSPAAQPADTAYRGARAAAQRALAGRGFQRSTTSTTSPPRCPSCCVGRTRPGTPAPLARTACGGSGRGGRRAAAPRRAAAARRPPRRESAGRDAGRRRARHQRRGELLMGPLPFSLPRRRLLGAHYRVSATRRCLREAIAMIPDGDYGRRHHRQQCRRRVVGAPRGVLVALHRRSADWVIVDQTRPFVLDKEDGACTTRRWDNCWCSNADFHERLLTRRGAGLQACGGRSSSEDGPETPGTSPSPGATPARPGRLVVADRVGGGGIQPSRRDQATRYRRLGDPAEDGETAVSSTSPTSEAATIADVRPGPRRR